MNTPVIIFLAEDNPGDILLVRQALREADLKFELLIASDGQDVASLLSQIGKTLPCPDVLLLDLNLPLADGPELFQLVRDHPLCGTLPLIVITSSESPRDRDWTSRFGVSRYFHKPFELEEFMKLGALVRETVEQSLTNRASSPTFHPAD